ncbi:MULTISPECIES: hypothetical protein [unclassified Streptomyces]|uniref:hypothetical protein n=1 Tax=unclassified Streptomyces TaxID=2593676 RepID=UPI00381C96CC
MTYRGDDIGRRLARRQRDFGRLDEVQQKRLAALGVQPAAQARKASASAGAKTGAARSVEALTRGLAAL